MSKQPIEISLADAFQGLFKPVALIGGASAILNKNKKIGNLAAVEFRERVNNINDGLKTLWQAVEWKAPELHKLMPNSDYNTLQGTQLAPEKLAEDLEGIDLSALEKAADLMTDPNQVWLFNNDYDHTKWVADGARQFKQTIEAIQQAQEEKTVSEASQEFRAEPSQVNA